MFGTALTIVVAMSIDAGALTARQAPQERPAPPPEVVWTDDRPLIKLFPNLLHDVRSLPSANSALVVSAGGAGTLAIKGGDTRFANWTARSGESAYARPGSMLGNGWVQSGGAIATYAVGKLAGSPQVTHVGSDLIRAQALNGLLTTAIKVSVGRLRPHGGHHAFPSGHTSATFASAATLHAHYGWKAGAPAFATAVFVAWSRAREGEHWLSDVAFGSAVGIIAGRTVAAKHGPGRLTVIPTPTKGGVAVTVLLNTTRKLQVTRNK